MSTPHGPDAGPPDGPPPRTSSTRRDDLRGEPPTVMTAREVAAYLRLNYNTLLDLTRAGLLPALAIGREHRYLRAAIDDTMRTPAPPKPADTHDADPDGPGLDAP